jgi:hypothetical protein
MRVVKKYLGIDAVLQDISENTTEIVPDYNKANP